MIKVDFFIYLLLAETCNNYYSLYESSSTPNNCSISFDEMLTQSIPKPPWHGYVFLIVLKLLISELTTSGYKLNFCYYCYSMKQVILKCVQYFEIHYWLLHSNNHS